MKGKNKKKDFVRKFYSDKHGHIMIQMLGFLPNRIREALRRLNARKVYEIRLRAGKPVRINYEGEYRYLGEYGVTDKSSSALTVSLAEIGDVVFSAGKFSVYSVEEQLRQGFLTADCGERIGLAGQYVSEKGKPLAMRDFTSLCIRVPHEIEGCGDEIYDECLQGGLRSVLVMSPPGIGKTTILRDLSRRLSRETEKNILVCDERGEISAGDTGDTSDVLLFADKATAFEAGIRAMRPDVMITDELSDADCAAVRRAIDGGVKVIASAHFGGMEELRPPFVGLFERYALLDVRSVGKLSGIYDERGRKLR